ncbi:MAG: HD domain-containing protein, partial [bacterium]|nr:HD domain-containing protein [bacterium]
EMNIETYLVGGGLRDLIVSGRASDYDFAVKERAKEIAFALAAELNGSAFELGRGDKACFRVAFKENDNLVEIDFSPFKDETIEKDLKKRDFTINAMALSLRKLFEDESPGILDPFNGRQDLLSGKLKLISGTAIDEDPLRILRGFRFAAAFSIIPDSEFLSLAREKRGKLSAVARERVRTEFFKMLAAESSYMQVNSMAETGVLSEIIPDISSWEEVEQGEWHRFALLKHSLKTLEYVETILGEKDSLFSLYNKQLVSHLGQEIEYGIDRRAMLKFASLLHDSGKPSTLEIRGEKVTFHSHEEAGAKLNSKIAADLKIGRAARSILVNITRQHMRILHLSKLEKISTKASNRFIRDCGDELPEVLLLALADTWATRDARDLDYTDVEGLVSFMLRLWIDRPAIPNEPFLNGNEVMEITGSKEGVEVGRYLALLADAEIDGLVSSKAQARQYLKQISNA